jgi:hypothetical protein
MSKPRKMGDRLPENSAAVIFEAGGIAIALPASLEPDADMPEHMLTAAAIGMRMLQDEEWRAQVCNDAREWLFRSMKEAGDKK